MYRYVKIIVLMALISLSGIGLTESTMIKGKFQKKFGENWVVYVSEDARYKIFQIDDYSMDEHGINHFAVKNNLGIYKKNNVRSISIKLSKDGLEGYYIDGVKYEDSILDAEIKLSQNETNKHIHTIAIKKDSQKTIITTQDKQEVSNTKEVVKVEPKEVVDTVVVNGLIKEKAIKVKTIKEIVYLIDKNITDKLITIEKKLKESIKKDKQGLDETSQKAMIIIEKIHDIKETIKNINLNLINSEKQRKALETKIKKVGADIGTELDNKIKGLSNGINGVLETEKAINKYLVEMNSVILSLMQEQRSNLKTYAMKGEAGRIKLAIDLKSMVVEMKSSDAIRSDQTRFMVKKIDEAIDRLDKLGAFAEGANIAKQVSNNIGKSYIEIKQILAAIEGRTTRSIELVGYENKAIRKDLGFIKKGIMDKIGALDDSIKQDTIMIMGELKKMFLHKKQNDSAISIKMVAMANNNASINKIVTGNGGVIRENKKSIKKNYNAVIERFNQVDDANKAINEITTNNGIVIRENKANREDDNKLMIDDMASKEKNILKKVEDSKDLAIDNQFRLRNFIERLEKKVDLQNKMINDIKAENDFFKNYDRKPDNAIRILVRSLFSIKEASNITILDTFDEEKAERVIDIHIGQMILNKEDVNGLNKVLNHKLRFVFGEDGVKRVGGILGQAQLGFC
jgi:hypothetical protein